MTTEEKIELEKRRLEAALKELDSKPDALLFLESEACGRDFDIPDKIHGLPVFYSSHLLNRVAARGYECSGVPWVPIWRNENSFYNVRDFNETYLELE